MKLEDEEINLKHYIKLNLEGVAGMSNKNESNTITGGNGNKVTIPFKPRSK